MKYLMTITYDGKNYNGFQRQNDKPTIQSEVEHALEILLKEKIEIIGSGRTDAKVSAYKQTINFETDKQIDKDKFIYSMNGILPSDIKVLDIIQSDIHARFTEKKKTYLYKMYISEFAHPLYKDRLTISKNIDIKAMKKFLQMIKGTHDFIGFKSAGSEVNSTVRTIYNAKLIKTNSKLDFYITGNGFLYKMVRNIVGTMLKVGEYKLDLKELKQTIFKTYKSTYTAPSEYLYLYDIKYLKKSIKNIKK